MIEFTKDFGDWERGVGKYSSYSNINEESNSYDKGEDRVMTDYDLYEIIFEDE